MYDAAAMATFVAVVRSGHFAAAARLLGLPKSTVSQRVARLEEALGVRLLERTTRALRPTSAGAVYFERCTRILAEVDEANAAVRALGTSPRGLLRVATSQLLGQALVAPIAASFSQRYPDVKVEVVASDRRANLLEEGIDLAVVVSPGEADSTIISRVLGSGETWCCAAPSYLAARGIPSEPGDLAAHDCIVRKAASDDLFHDATWTFERDGEVDRVEIKGRLRLNTIMMVHSATLAGAAIAAIPSFVCTADVAEGRLVRLLSDWVIDRKDIRIVYPSNRHLPARVRLFADMIISGFPAIAGGRKMTPLNPPITLPG